MTICEWIFEVPESDSKETVAKRELLDIPPVTPYEFGKSDMAVEIYSEVLECTLWFCSDEEMAGQVKDETPGAVCYTADELRLLLKLKPGKESLRRIHDIKVIFPGSTIKEANIKTGGADKDHLLEGADIGRAGLSDDES